MSLSLKSVLVLLTLTPSAFAGTTAPPEACSRLADMLLENQLNAPRENPSANAASERSLKKAFRSLCEGNQVRTEAGFTFDNGRPLFEHGRWFRPDGSEQKLNTFELAAQYAAILQPFLDAHRACAGGCGYVSWGIWGDEAHQARRSCHNSGEAIDIHAITCGGTHVAMSARFNSYVSCMRGHLGVIYNRGPGDHQDHAHYELHNCNMCVGLGCGGGRGKGKGNGSDGVDNGEDDGKDEVDNGGGSPDDQDSGDESGSSDEEGGDDDGN